jgi:hypothetical protein
VPADGSLAMEVNASAIVSKLRPNTSQLNPMGRIALSAPLAFHVIVYSAIDGMAIWSLSVQ